MIARLGHAELANAIRKLTEASSRVAESQATDHARRLLEEGSDELSMSRDEYRVFRGSVGGRRFALDEYTFSWRPAGRQAS